MIEYALPSSLPSGRETFHAKVVLADDSEFYVGSSNFMGSALERSFECGVFVRLRKDRKSTSDRKKVVTVAQILGPSGCLWIWVFGLNGWIKDLLRCSRNKVIGLNKQRSKNIEGTPAKTS